MYQRIQPTDAVAAPSGDGAHAPRKYRVIDGALAGTSITSNGQEIVVRDHNRKIGEYRLNADLNYQWHPKG